MHFTVPPAKAGVRVDDCFKPQFGSEVMEKVFSQLLLQQGMSIGAASKDRKIWSIKMMQKGAYCWKDNFLNRLLPGLQVWLLGGCQRKYFSISRFLVAANGTEMETKVQNTWLVSCAFL